MTLLKIISTKTDNYYHNSKNRTFLKQVYRTEHKKVFVNILQGSVVTQTGLGELTIYCPVPDFPQCTCTKNYEISLTLDKVIARIITQHTLLSHPVYTNTYTVSQKKTAFLLLQYR